MKKIILFTPLLLLFMHFMYETDGPNMWSQSLSGSGPIWSVSVCQSNQNVIYAASYTMGVFKTTNAGLNWAQMNGGLTNLVLQTICVSATNPDIVMVGTTNGGSNPGIYRSTNGGSSWTWMVSGITDTANIQQVLIHPSNPNIAWIGVFTGTGNSSVGLFKTTNGGANWFASNSGIGTIKNILSLAVNPLNPNVVYCGTSFMVGTSTGPSQIYRSNDGGATWNNASSGLPSATTEINPVRIIDVSNADTSLVLAGLFMNTTNGGAYVSTNGGQSWTKRHTGMPTATGTLIRGGIIRPGSTNEFYVGLDGSTPRAVFRTTDAGLSWTNFVGGPLLNTYTVRGLAFKTSGDSTLYAGGAFTTTAGQGVFEYSFIPVGVSGNNGQIPKDYALHQNYPNPFNPVTNIQFDLPKESFVTLKVFDIRGKEVQTLVNESKQAGTYYIIFDASQLSSGIYFYKISSGDYNKTMKMVLVK